MKIHAVRACAALTLLLALAAPASAQAANPEALRGVTRTQLPMRAALHRFALAVAAPGANEELLCRRFGVPRRADGRVELEVVGPLGQPALSAELVLAAGGQVHHVWRHRACLFLPPTRILDLARSLPQGHLLMASEPPSQSGFDGGSGNSGPALQCSDGYVAGGDDGAGRTVAILDTGYLGLTNAITNGWAPNVPIAQRIDFTGIGIEAGTQAHGLFTLMTTFAHAPGANYWIFKIGNSTEYALACDIIAASNVDISNSSLGFTGTGWEDDSGSACAGMLTMANAGVLNFVSAGNFGETHWQGFYTPGAFSAGFHDWVVGDELHSATLQPGEWMPVSLSWPAASNMDLDLYLYDSTGTVILESSASASGSTESLSIENTSNQPKTYAIVVSKVSGPDAAFEIFTGQYVNGEVTLEYPKEFNSLASPANTTHANVLAVSAVSAGDYGSLPGSSGIVTDYSSRGPTNGVSPQPRICAPTTTSVPSGGSFVGTSASSPNAAGMAAALWSSAPQLSAAGLRYLIERQAGLKKDWGAAGYDSTYGAGGAVLHPWHANTTWLDRAAPNFANLPSFPYRSVDVAQSAAQAGGRLLFLGGTYPEPVLLEKALLLETTQPEALLGD